MDVLVWVFDVAAQTRPYGVSMSTTLIWYNVGGGGGLASLPPCCTQFFVYSYISAIEAAAEDDCGNGRRYNMC